MPTTEELYRSNSCGRHHSQKFERLMNDLLLDTSNTGNQGNTGNAVSGL